MLKTHTSASATLKHMCGIGGILRTDGKPIPADSDKPPADLGAQESLPDWYSDSQKSQETAEVDESGGTIDFKLSTKKPRGAGGLMPR